MPFDVTCFYSPSEDSTDEDEGNELDNGQPRKARKRRLVKRKAKQVLNDFRRAGQPAFRAPLDIVIGSTGDQSAARETPAATYDSPRFRCPHLLDFHFQERTIHG